MSKVEDAKEKCKTDNKCWHGGGGGAVYGIGFIGAVIYFIQYADGFWMGALGILKAIVWPAFVVYDLLKYLGM